MSAKIQSKPNTGPIVWGLAMGFVVWASALFGWIQMRMPDLIRTQLMTLSPFFLWIGLAVLIIAWVKNQDILKEFTVSCTRGQRIGLVLVAVLAFSLVHGVAPRIHRIFYDEDIYEEIGLDIAQNNQAALSNDGRWHFGRFESLLKEYNKEPNGWPFVISLGYRLFGVSEAVSFNIANGLFVFAVLLVFMCGSLLFESPEAGLLAAAIYAMIPENVLWFSTVAVEPPTACFSLLAMACLLYFFKTRSSKALFLTAAAWAFAVQFRPEILMLGWVPLIWFCSEGWEEGSKPRLYGFLLLFLVLISVHLAHLYVMRTESWGNAGPKFSIPFFIHNIKTNTLYYVDGHKFPLLFSFLVLAGLLMPRQGKSKFYAVLWFLISWGIFLFFYAGSYTFGADVRFSLLSMAPLALLAGRGAHQLLAVGRRRFPGWATPVFILLLSLNLLAYLPLMRAAGQEAWQCRADHNAAEQFAKLVPDDGIIMTHNPNMFHLWGKNAAQLSLFQEHADYATRVISATFPGKVYLHWNYWCGVADPVQVNFCNAMFSSYETELVQAWPLKEPRLALYRVLGPKKEITRNIIREK